MNSYHLSLIAVVREAHALLSAIPDEQWQPTGFYDHNTGRSDMLGHFVRCTYDVPPLSLSRVQYMLKAAKLANAINNLLDYCIHPEDNPMDAYSICPGNHPYFQQATPKERSIECLALILRTCDVSTPPLNKKLSAQIAEVKTTERKSNYSTMPAEYYYPIA